MNAFVLEREDAKTDCKKFARETAEYYRHQYKNALVQALNARTQKETRYHEGIAAGYRLAAEFLETVVIMPGRK